MNPKLKGKLLLAWEINDQGKSQNFEVVKSVNKALDKCVVDKISGWKFPKVKKGEIAKIKYPIIFEPLAKEKKEFFL